MNLAEHTEKVKLILSTTFPNHNVKELEFKDISYFNTEPDKPSVFLCYDFHLKTNKPQVVNHLLSEIKGYISFGITKGSLSTFTLYPLNRL